VQPARTGWLAPTLLAYDRYQGSVMAPQAAVWGPDNRGAMLRVIGAPGDPATRIENRLGEPLANPYLYMAAQVFAGIDGLQRQLQPNPASDNPYQTAAAALPASLGQALQALAEDSCLQQGLGKPMAHLFDTIKRQELARAESAEDLPTFLRREYFSRY
jgi:glutamine synthetase